MRTVPVPAFLMNQISDPSTAAVPTTLSGRTPTADTCRCRRTSEVVAAGRDPGRAAEDHPHDLRHTAASLSVSAGANVKALQRMLGTSRPR